MKATFVNHYLSYMFDNESFVFSCRFGFNGKEKDLEGMGSTEFFEPLPLAVSFTGFCNP